MKKLKHITVICKELYEAEGASAVYDFVRNYLKRQPNSDIDYKDCTPCEANTPQLNGVCLICGTPSDGAILIPVPSIGDKLDTMGQLRDVTSHLQDNDQICIETIDLDTGDVQDLYPMYVDVIDGIELTNGETVSEIRFCQMPNSEPDDRDVQPIVDAVIEQLKDDMSKGDYTVLDELLKFIPRQLLINSLPEKDWQNFTAEAMRETLINKVFQKYYSDDEPKYDGKNRAYLDTLSNDELEMKL